MKDKKTPKETLDHDEQDERHDVLKAIYQRSSSGKMPLDRLAKKMPRFSTKKKALLIAAGFLVLASAAAVLGFVVFNGSKKFSSKDVSVVVQGPDAATSGDAVVLTVNVINEGKVALKSVQLTMRFPTDFSFQTSTPSPSNDYSNVWTLPDIAPGKSEDVKISGTLVGELGSTKSFSATVSYMPANFSSAFLATTEYELAIQSSTLDLDVTAPRSAVPKQELSYSVKVTNTSDETVRGARLQLLEPEGWSRSGADPKPNDTNQWNLPELAAGDSFTVTLQGTLDGAAGEAKEFGAKVGVLDGAGAFLVQRETSALVLLLGATLNLTTSVNGKTDAFSVTPGDSLTVAVAYENDSDSVLRDVEATVAFSGRDSLGKTVAPIDAGQVSGSPAPKVSDDRTSVTWTKEQVPALASLKPGEHGTVTVTLPVSKNVRSLGSGTNIAVLVTTSASATVVDAGSNVTADGETLTFPVDTELRLSSFGAYYNGDGVAVGSGPVPPEVGATTQYVITFSITNTLNGVKNALLSATLPDGATFVSGTTSGGNSITYDATTHKVTWRIDAIDAGTGQSVPTLTGACTISVTPTAGDVGKTLPLLGQTTLSATDAFTGTALSATADAITTELPDDPLAAGKGVVIAPSATNTNGGE